jgi:gephyrin
MMSQSLKVTPLAMLSRLTAGIRKKTVIVNFPGSKKASQECFGFVLPALVHAVDLVTGQKKERVEKTHRELQDGGGGCSHNHHHHSGKSRVDTSNIAGRDRISPWPMISVKEAQDMVLNHCDALGTETVAFGDALGRVLAQDVEAREPLPPFPASVKDGYKDWQIKKLQNITFSPISAVTQYCLLTVLVSAQ